MTSTRLEWFKSSYCSNDGPECVEIAIAPAATVHVRDSKDTQRAQLAFTGASWTEFVSSVRR
jgi:hypothetical protein